MTLMYPLLKILLTKEIKMKNNIFLPKKIRVGFQKRQDTYTQKLAYVIYYDEKNKLRKEASWESWRDKKIAPVEFDNVPTSEFVLNKKVGGYKSGWDFRNAYVRVYDPRGFEFEITVSNLLFILENTNSIKGKGLEGEFVYGWQGTDLILIPVSSPNYEELTKFNNLKHSGNHIKGKDLILGATYKHKSNVPLIYMGRFNNYSYPYQQGVKNKGLHYYFMRVENKDSPVSYYSDIRTFKSIGENFIEVIDDTCTPNYAKLFDKLECDAEFSPIDEYKTEYIEYSLDEVYKLFTNGWKYVFLKRNNKTYAQVRLQNYNGRYGIDYYNSTSQYRTTPTCTSIEEFYKSIKVCYQKKYLLNGKLYNSTK